MKQNNPILLEYLSNQVSILNLDIRNARFEIRKIAEQQRKRKRIITEFLNMIRELNKE